MSIPDKNFDENGFKSFDEMNKTFLTTWKKYGKRRMKRMTSVFMGYMRNISMARRILAGLLAMILFIGTLSGLIDTTWANPEHGTIVEFERVNPVNTETVDNGTAKDDLDLPETLRAVVEIPDVNEETVTEESGAAIAASETAGESEAVPEGDSGQAETAAESEPSEPIFTQTAPVADEDGDYDYYWYGYVAPQNEDELFEAGEPVIYTIYYEDNTEAYRVFGKYDDTDESFYVCDENGEITGIVKEVPITWSCKDYEANKVGTYTFTAEIADGYDYDGEMPIAEITVNSAGEEEEQGEEQEEEQEQDDDGEEGEVICTCGSQTETHDEDCAHYTPECTCDHADEGHIKGCPLWNPDCICPEGTLGHTSENCPYFVPLSDCDCGIDSGRPGWEHNKGCKYYSAPECTCKDGVHDYSNVDCLKYVSASVRSLNGGGANDVAGDNLMAFKATTSGSSGYTGVYASGIVPGSWVDYVNTIWMNKAYNKFTWTPAGNTGAHNGWSWSNTPANTPTSATITVTNTATATPAPVGGIWTVYSGEQLRYALDTFSTGDTIILGANIDLNGSVHNWGTVDLMHTRSFTLDGNGNVIYNLGSTSSTSGNGTAAFITRTAAIAVTNITFATAKLVASEGNDNGVFGSTTGIDRQRTYKDVEIKDSLIFGQNVTSVFGRLDTGSTTGNSLRMDKCFANGNYIYGATHVTAFLLGARQLNATYCGSYGNLLCGTQEHSAGFLSCVSEGSQTISYCFASNEIYGSLAVSGFGGPLLGTWSNCYSSGKLEGYALLGGFVFGHDNAVPITYYNCYSTTLIGLRIKAAGITTANQMQGGFASWSTPAALVQMTNCYAAGEVGNYDISMSGPGTVGGFISSTKNSATFSSCYYDKQTTAMREWVAGDTQTISGITGVLTTKTDKAGFGLAAGNPAGATSGFTGFTNNNEWVYTSEHYPQLEVFADAASADWGSAERADAVKAWSLASTSTVFLDTWDSGFDWDDDGVRTPASYDRTLASTGKPDHKGYEYTYDTVREIVSDFDTTNITDNSTTWTQLIPGGAPVDVTDINGDTATAYGSITISGGEGKVGNPGMDWYKVSETVNGQTGYRPLRLIAYMNVAAGDDESVASGALYDHREGVELTMMDSITDNLVVGLHDTSTWSTAVTQAYPDTDKYYEAVTAPTGFSASQDAWVYTEISRVKKDTSGGYVTDANGDYVPEYSVNVTGPGTGSNTTIDEQKWNGEEPLYADTSVGHKYIITYHWMLSDGRYRTDDKIVTITPGEYDVTVNVYNAGNSTANSTALYTDAAPDSGASPAYSFGAATSADAETLGNTYTTNVSAAWKKHVSNTKITQMAVTMTDLNGNEMGTAAITGDIKAGDTITITIKYLYLTTADDLVAGMEREVTKTETVDVTYTIKSDGAGGYYLQFNKLANAPDNEVASAKEHGDSTGIPDGTKAYINDLTYNIQIDLYVEEAGELTVRKVLTDPAEEEEQFVFQVDYRGNAAEAGDVGRTMYAVITIPAGETEGTAQFVEMPAGWYTVTELDSNWRFDLLTEGLESDNPDAMMTGEDVEDARVTMKVEGNSPTYTYQNKRLDVPWANGKDSVTNHMPALTSTASARASVTSHAADAGSGESRDTKTQGNAVIEAVLPGNDEKEKSKAAVSLKSA